MLHAIDVAYRNLGITTFHAETHENNKRVRRMLEKIDFKVMDWNKTEQQFRASNGTIMYRLMLEEVSECHPLN
ncbi:hypothetical protein GQ671_12215 [Salinicoccus hispanicus]|uniref:GNAT family N-acetyltransferase n=2 Tax=Salinicoccus hispanicus TaxID=157225 RepID=A0A6N8U8N0_9STAP|nr:hypothetical protein [Salinicoccus hispanicus]